MVSLLLLSFALGSPVHVAAGAPTNPADSLPVWRTLETVPYRGKQDDVVFVNPDLGWYGNGEGKIYRTTDAGATWQLQWDHPGTFVRTLAFVDETTGFAGNVGTGYFPGVTDETLLYKTTDAGATWAPVPAAQIEGIAGLCAMEVLRTPFINHGVLETKTRVYAAGRVGGPAWLMHSDDLGETWTATDLKDHAGMVLDVHFFDLNHGLIAASSSDDVTQGTARILRTQDAGRTWTVAYDSGRPFENVWKMSFPTPEIGYATVQSYNPEATERFVIKTTDAGRTWTELPLVDDARVRQFGIGFLDERRGWVGAVPHAFATTDGGATWTPAQMGQAVNKVRVLHTPAGPVAYAIGVQVLKADGREPGLDQDPANP
ncbi:WD40/YVTN/BNR-like repeat-containing protein [Nodularia spumigena]|uniref:WD40/YVTN/BNR-like repeat-containing protein n=1 Tax=Nodularia spumigena TaxID=70799 RepID=UPI002B1F23CE|nr:hypothetical protein [Nodularia spumigena]MEA5614566.1 hypothetical protein [Nodularia spumigena UHCC 0040]